jgi:hypothetical protein
MWTCCAAVWWAVTAACACPPPGDYKGFVAAAHARYEAYILERGAWRLATGHIISQVRHYRVYRRHVRHIRRKPRKTVVRSLG